MLKRDIDFLYEIGTLRNLERSWKQVIGLQCASVLEHTVRVAFLALLIARMEGEKNEEKILKMSLVHDLAEARTGDPNAVHSVYIKRNEKVASSDMFTDTHFMDLNSVVLQEYEERKTTVAKIVKDADNLEVDLELKELEERGSFIPKKWSAVRRLVRNKKLYTKSAKKLWDEIQKSDPTSWYLLSMKLWKIKGMRK